MLNNASYFRLVTLVIPGITGGNTGTNFTFDDQPDLRYARMLSIVAYTNISMAYAQPQPTPVISPLDMPKISLVLQTNDPDDMVVGPGKKQKGQDGRFSGTLDTIQWLPLAQINTTQFYNTALGTPAFVHHMINWKDRYIIWQKSKVVIGTGGLGNTTDVAVALGVFYTFTNSDGKVIFPRN